MRRISWLRPYVAEVASGVLLLATLWLGSWTVASVPQNQENGAVEQIPPAEARVSVDSLQTVEGTSSTSLSAFLAEQCDLHLPETEGWVSLDGPQVVASSDYAALTVLAVRLPAGVAILLRNTGDVPAAMHLRVRLPAGRYAADRLAQVGQEVRTERLQSAASTAARAAEKPGIVQSHSVVVYRFINPVASSGTAYRRAMHEIGALQASHPVQYRRLRSALAECPWNLTRAQAAATNPDPSAALEHVHRALLTVRHAQALCTNGVGLRRIPAGVGQRVSSELDALEAWLTEASVALLGLVPSATASPVSQDGRVRQVTVAVRNAGPRSVSSLRLWAKGNDDAHVEPSDAVVFPVLKPGETASATFRVTLPEGGAASAISGHVGYVARNSPAHLRLTCY